MLTSWNLNRMELPACAKNRTRPLQRWHDHAPFSRLHIIDFTIMQVCAWVDRALSGFSIWGGRCHNMECC